MAGTPPAGGGRPSAAMPDAGEPVAAPTQPCSSPPPGTDPPALINARWQETEVKCGDNATMLADTQRIPAGEAATFTVKQVSDSSTVDTVNSTTGASSIQGTEVARKPTDDWAPAPDLLPELKFTVAAHGLTADSADPQLALHRYANIRRRNFNQHMTSGVYGWERRVRVELTDRVLIIHVPIKVKNRSAARPVRAAGESDAAFDTRCEAVAFAELTAAEKRSFRGKIERVFRHKKALHRHRCTGGCGHQCARKCCKFEIKVIVDFYNSTNATPASVVNLWPGGAGDRPNAANWFKAHTGPVFAHEVGHLMGFYDEYDYNPHPAWGPAPWRHPHAGHVMDDYGGRLANYYFQIYATWLANSARTGEPWDVVAYS
jgi:hypothetical protein